MTKLSHTDRLAIRFAGVFYMPDTIDAASLGRVFGVSGSRVGQLVRGLELGAGFDANINRLRRMTEAEVGAMDDEAWRTAALASLDVLLKRYRTLALLALAHIRNQREGLANVA